MRSLVKFKYILGIIIPFLTFFLMSQNIYAVSFDTNRLGLKYNPDNQGYRWSGEMLYGQPTGGTNGVNYINLSLGYSSANKYYFKSATTTAQGNYATVHFETNLVLKGPNSTYLGYFPPANLPYIEIIDCNGSTGAFAQAEIISRDKSYDVTYWDNNSAITLTFRGTMTLRNIGQGSSGQLLCTMGSEDFAFLSTFNTFSSTYVNRFYFEQNPMSIEWSNNINDALLQQQVYQQQTLINITNEHYDKENQATDNISNQNTSDIDGASNQATTNLIGVLSSFLTQLQGFSATNCNLSMPFPEFFGGTQVVNICQGKDVLGNFITLVGTLAMVGFYIPLAIVLLKMIYNEIRSFTNG